MSHGHAHEEAEHATHHSHDPFDRRVALTMMVVAALLAGVRVVAHRTHNAHLSYQIESGAAQTQASNLFSFFQSKRQRMELALLRARQMEDVGLLTRDQEEKDRKAPRAGEDTLPDKEAREKRILKDLQDEDVHHAEEEAAKIVASGEKVYAGLRQKRFSPERSAQIAALEMDVRRYRLEADAINPRARAMREKADDDLHKAEHKHHQADWFDGGELFVELALVLCSVAILTKRPPFWYAGMGVCAFGLVIVGVGFFIRDGGGHSAPGQSHHAEAGPAALVQVETRR